MVMGRSSDGLEQLVVDHDNNNYCCVKALEVVTTDEIIFITSSSSGRRPVRRRALVLGLVALLLTGLVLLAAGLAVCLTVMTRLERDGERTNYNRTRFTGLHAGRVTLIDESLDSVDSDETRVPSQFHQRMLSGQSELRGLLDESAAVRPEVHDNSISQPSSSTSGSESDVNGIQRLPDAIIIGVKKGGTRALLEFLRTHPDVRAPGPEIHFFDRNYDRGLDWYRSQMPATLPWQLTLEKTPSYFITHSAPSRVFNMSSAVRLIVVVRDPVTRAVSDYAQAIAKRPGLGSFERRAFTPDGLVDTSWGAIKIGVYARHLERWLDYVPRDRIHFVNGERLISDPTGQLADVQQFLGLRPLITDKHFYFNATKGFPCLRRTDNNGNSSHVHCLGKTKGRMHPIVDPKALQRLRNFYKPFNSKFYKMTGIDFGWQ